MTLAETADVAITIVVDNYSYSLMESSPGVERYGVIAEPLLAEHGLAVFIRLGDPYHLFYLLLPSLEERQAFMAHLKTNNVASVFHYLPLHLSRMGRHFGGEAAHCPVTEDVSERLARLPFHNSLVEEDLERVVSLVKQFQCGS